MSSCKDFPALLDAARPFLRGQLEQVDPELPSLIAVLRSAGAGECWHKRSSFLTHLTDVYRILKLWGAPDAVARCGLYHSAYSNSNVNLAIFDLGTGRKHVQDIIGVSAEKLVHFFCIVPRHPIIHNDLLSHYSDEELIQHLEKSENSLIEAVENGVFDASEQWRSKLQSLLPAEGITVKHIRTGEDVLVPRRVMATFLFMTMADFSDQRFDFQDKLFENHDGKLSFGGNTWTTLWPGEWKPGLSLGYISRMGVLYALVVREEQIYKLERKTGRDSDEDYNFELVIPPVFSYCTRVLDAKEQIEARDLYWEAIVSCGSPGDVDHWNRVAGLLLKSSEKNPFVGEPHLVLGQVYLNVGRYEEAEKELEKGLKLMLEWGCCWDKRMAWDGWVAWGRVLLMKAKEKCWVDSSWGIINLGLVK